MSFKSVASVLLLVSLVNAIKISISDNAPQTDEAVRVTQTGASGNADPNRAIDPHTFTTYDAWKGEGRNPFHEAEPYGLEDDEVQSRINNLRDPECSFKIDCGGTGLRVLDDKTIDRFIKTSDRAYIMYHLDVSTKATNAYLEFAAAVKEAGLPVAGMGTVACHDYTYTCTNYGAVKWPTLKVYEHGKFVGDYKGAWDRVALAVFIQNFNDGNPIVLSKIGDVESFMKGENVDRHEKVQRVTLGLFNKYDDTDSLNYVDVGHHVRGRAVMGIATGPVAHSIVQKYFANKQLPIIVTVATEGDKIMDPEFFCPIKSDLESFVMKSQALGTMFLTTTVFPKIFQRGLPVAIAIGCPKTLPKLLPAYYQTAKMLKDKIAFTELCVKYDKELADQITEQFQVSESDTPAVVVSMPSQGRACVLRKNDLNGLTEETLGSALENCLTGGQKTMKLPKYDWTNRLPMYDYHAQYYNTGPINSDTQPRPLKPLLKE